MKYITLCMVLLLALPLFTIAIPEPELLQTVFLESEVGSVSNSITFIGDVTNKGRVQFPGGDIVIVPNYNASGTRILGYQLTDGTKIYDQQINGQTHFLHAAEGWMVGCAGLFFNSQRLKVWDFTNPLFATQEFDQQISSGTQTSNACHILDVQGSEITIYQRRQNQKRIYNIVGNNLTADSAMPFTGDIPPTIITVDTENKIIGGDTGFYRWYDTNETINKIFDIGGSSGTIDRWNGDEDNPIYFTTNGKMILAGDYSSPVVTSISVDFLPHRIYTQDQMYGQRSTNNNMNGLDFTNVAIPAFEQYSTLSLIANNLTAGGVPDYPGHFVSYNPNATDKPLQFWAVEGFTGEDLFNTPPTISATLLGVDSQSLNFVFGVQIRDVDGGSVYRAIDVSPAGEFSLLPTSVTQDIDFDQSSDLDLLSGFGIDICEVWNISFTSGTPQFDIDGHLFYNQSTGCVGFVAVDTPDLYQANNDVVTIETSFWFESFDGFTHPIIRNYEIRDATGDWFAQLTINQTSSSTAQIFHYDNLNDNFIGNYSFNEGSSFWFIRADVNFLTNTVDFEIRDGLSGVLLDTFTIPFLKDVNSVGSVAYSTYSLEDGYMFIDNVASVYTVAGQLPTWLFHANLEPGQTRTKDVRAAITDGFGLYEATIFATDDVIGFDNYTIFTELLFEYNEFTPVLTESEISELINGFNAGEEDVFEEGDFITDTFQNFIESIGLTTTYSKMFVGFLLLLIVMGFMSPYPVEAQLLIGTIAFLLLTIWGFFPAWLLIIVIILCVSLVAVAMRRVFVGNS